VVSNERPKIPRPVADADTQPFWDGAGQHRLMIPHCPNCGHWVWQPKPICPKCQHPDLEWLESDGRAQLVSWTVIHPPVLAAYGDDVPFIIILVELTDAPLVRLVGHLVGDDGALVHSDSALSAGVGMSLRWTERDDITLPVWALED
jgi:uncharacterized OB-fold protein